MEVAEALEVLGLHEGAARDDIRAAYRRRLRAVHPDMAGPERQGAGAALANRATSRVIDAHATLVAHLEAAGTDAIVLAPPPAPPAPPPPRPPTPAAAAPDPVPAAVLDEDTIAVDAPADETYVALYEAASTIGEVAYVDRQLGILETIVRFEGGPSCSVVLTLQGRAHFTEVFATMESIEAAPTPPIAPVIDALTAVLRGEPL